MEGGVIRELKGDIAVPKKSFVLGPESGSSIERISNIEHVCMALREGHSDSSYC